MRGMKRKYTIENFCECVPWEQIKSVMSKRDFKAFCSWMAGQTSVNGGVFKGDLKRYLADLPVLD